MTLNTRPTPSHGLSAALSKLLSTLNVAAEYRVGLLFDAPWRNRNPVIGHK